MPEPASKSNQNDKAAPDKQQPYQTVADQVQPIHPRMLQRAIENPHAATPAEILQLQRQYGNRAVAQMTAKALAQKRPGPTPPLIIQPSRGNATPKTPIKSNIVQRELWLED